jgi:beta-lactamase regulating signal transducer with metallopeptidase domain
MISSLADAFTWILRGSAQAAVAAIAVLCVHTLFRRLLPARWRYALWLAVPAAWLLPRMPETPISVAQYADPAVVRYVYAVDSVVDSRTPIELPTTFATRGSRDFIWQEIAGLVWALAAIGLLSYWTIGHRRTLRRLRETSQQPDEALLSLVQECGLAIGLRTLPEVLESRAISSPAVTGLLHPLFLLPSGLRERFSSNELRLMLLHELAHVRRGDLITNAGATVMLALHWFNPVLWLAASRIRADRESACDATVLSLAGTDERAAYGETLLKLQAELTGLEACPTFVGILENTRRIRDRILRIAAFHRGGTGWGLCAIALTTGLLACLAANPPAPLPVQPAPATQPPPSLEYRLRQISAKTQQILIESSVREISPEQLSQLASVLPSLRSRDERPGVFDLFGVLDEQKRTEFVAHLPPPTDPKEYLHPSLTTRNGQRAVIEIIREFRYPLTWADPDPKLQGAPATPTSFETRNLGASLEVEAGISMIPRPMELATIDLEVSPNITFFVGWQEGKTARGLSTRSPKFSTTNPVRTSVTLYDGHSLVMIGHLDIPNENPWGFKNTDFPGEEIQTHRGILLWVITPRLIKGEDGQVANGGLAPELFAPRDWQFTNMPIEQCVAHFTGMSRLIDPQKRGLNIVLGKPATEVRHVTLDLKRTNLIAALELAAKAAGFRAEEGGSNTVILTP